MINNHSEELITLQKIGFSVNPLNKAFGTLSEAWKYSNQINEQREKLLYDIDGLVVKLNNNVLTEAIGVVGKTPRAWCAIKFAPDEVVSKLIGVIWQVGRTGKLTPVVEIEPVILQGTTVRRATLHNLKNFKALNLRKNDYLVIRKAGDIIPEVVQVVR